MYYCILKYFRVELQNYVISRYIHYQFKSVQLLLPILNIFIHLHYLRYYLSIMVN